MVKLVPLKAKTIEKILLRNGFILNHTTGSHKQYYHPNKLLHVTVPFHSGEISLGTLRSIIKQSELSINVFRR